MPSFLNLYKTLNWTVLFERIIPNNIDYEIVLDDETLTIIAKNENVEQIAHAIQNTIATPETFASIMPFEEIKSQNKSSLSATQTTSVVDYPAEPTNELESGISILNKVYGTTKFPDISLNLRKFFPHNKDQCLYTKPTTIEPTVRVYKTQLDYLKSALKEIGLERLQNAYLGREKLEIKNSNSQTETEIEGLINTCFGIKESVDPLTRTKSYVGIFDYKALWQILFPPQPTIITLPQGNENQKAKIIFNLSHLSARMAVLFEKGYVVTCTSEQEARLIAFGKKLNSPPLVCELLIDISGSMKAALPLVIDGIVAFSKKMWGQNPTAEIRLTAFSKEIIPCKSYWRKSDPQKTSVLETDIEEIKTDLKKLVADDSTNLFGALTDRLIKLKQNYNNLGKSVIVVCTDGKDNVTVTENYTAMDAAKKLNPLLQQFGSNPPQLFMLGTTDCDQDALKHLTDQTKGELVLLHGGVEKFGEKVLYYTEEMAIERRVTEFVITVGEKTQHFKAAIELNGSIQDLGITIPTAQNNLPITIQKDHQPATTFVIRNEQSKVITNTQRLTEIATQLIELANDEENSAMTVISQLQDLKTKLHTLQNLTPIESKQKNEIAEQIQSTADTLRDATQTSSVASTAKQYFVSVKSLLRATRYNMAFVTTFGTQQSIPNTNASTQNAFSFQPK